MGNEKDRASLAARQREMEAVQGMQGQNMYEQALKHESDKFSPVNQSISGGQESIQESSSKYKRQAYEPQPQSIGRSVVEPETHQPQYMNTTSEPERKQNTYMQSSVNESTPSFVKTSAEAEHTSFVKSSGHDGASGAAMSGTAEPSPASGDGKRGFVATEDYSKKQLLAGADPLLEAQKEYDMKMRGMLHDQLSAEDAAVKERFKTVPGGSPLQYGQDGQAKSQSPVNPKTAVVFSGGKGQETQVLSASKIRTASESPSHMGGIRTAEGERVQGDGSKIRIHAEQKQDSGIKVSDERAHVGMRQDSQGDVPSWVRMENDGPQNTAGRQADISEYGVHAVGGKFQSGYVTGKDDAVYHSGAVVTNYANLYKNPELAKKFGIHIQNMPGGKKQQLVLASGKAKDIKEDQILFELKKAGYDDKEATSIATEIFSAIHSGTIETQTARHDDNFQSIMLKAQGSMTKDSNIKISMQNGKVQIMKPVGILACKTGITIEKPMTKLSRGVSQYTTGTAEQNGAEAGRGISQIRQAARVASIFAPSGSAMANKVFAMDLQQHLNGFVSVPIGKGKTQQFTVAEMKQMLANAGISKEAIDKCNIGADFGGWAKNLLSENKKINPASADKFAENQMQILKTLSKSRGATVLDRRSAINAVYKKYGVEITGDYGHYSNQRVVAKMKEVVKKYGGKENVPAELLAAVKEEKFISNSETYKNAGGRKLQKVLILTKGQVEKAGGDAGKGLAVSTRMANIATKLTMTGIKAGWATTVVARELAQKAALLAAKGMLAAARAANAVGTVTRSKTLMNMGKKLKGAGLKTNSASNRFKAFNRNVNAKGRTFGRDLREKLKNLNPVHRTKQMLKQKMAQFWAKKLQSKGVVGVFSRGVDKMFHGFAKMFRLTGAIKAKIKKYLMIALGIFLLIYFFACVIMGAAGSVVAIFDGNSQDYDTKQYVAQVLKELYEDDVKFITDEAEKLQNSDYNADTNPNVDHVEKICITYEDYKDYDKYAKAAEEAEVTDFFQSSNNGEILAMALIMYNFDLGVLKDTWYSSDPVGNTRMQEVEKYVRQLYYGSHYLTVTVDTKTVTEETSVPEGEEVSEDVEPYSYNVYTINATYKTYYYDYLFDCELKDAPQRVSNTSPTTGNMAVCGSWDSIYYAIRNAGYTHAGACGAMANIACESGGQAFNNGSEGPDPAALNSSGAFGVCQWMNGRRTELEAWCTSMGYDYTSTSGQISFMLYEISSKSGYSATRTAMQDASLSAADVAKAFGKNFEGYKDPDGSDTARRMALATKISDYYEGYQDDFSGLQGAGSDAATLASSYIGQIHYTQGRSPYIGTRVMDRIENAIMVEGDATQRGTDCSGFVHAVMGSLGVTGVPTTSSGYAGLTPIPIAQAAPGDVAWRPGHVGIVVGDGQVAQMSTCKGGSSSETSAHSSDGKFGQLSSFDCVYRFAGGE